jgi:hypothetical protein
MAFARCVSGIGCVSLGMACTSPDYPDLPKGWEDAERVSHFLQLACPGADSEPGDERMDVRGAEREVLIEYYDAPFRCAQELEAYSKESGSQLDVLVQPVDMHPENVTKCDCLYELHLLVETWQERRYAVDLYRRWDHFNSDNDPVEVASTEVSTAVE